MRKRGIIAGFPATFGDSAPRVAHNCSSYSQLANKADFSTIINAASLSEEYFSGSFGFISDVCVLLSLSIKVTSTLSYAQVNYRDIVGLKVLEDYSGSREGIGKMDRPFGHEMGLAMTMGPRLKCEVERQLILDLNHYHPFSVELRFDWSYSCIEGKCMDYLDGSLDRFSSISVYDAEGEMVCDGWMDFLYVQENDQLIVYWEYLDIYIDETMVEAKTTTGVPEHIKRMYRLGG
ncbi:hypothetical protein [Paenibacillus sp. PAMC21692]|uniref:hypothetical protein n=1 Tax=Paenibacillus sp. PAMC21692 TaxID=2762320 RepID=UPI00164DEB89|nr:hypothetical protein [Paenibacillus sp. PAMC21692]QNK58901.1 hypothetical protein H7F31_08570 [Paenibacillus sp. PAMC21692]